MMMALELSYLSSHFFSFLCVFGQPASLAHPSTGGHAWNVSASTGVSLRVAPFCGGVCSFGVFLLFAASAPRPSSASSVASVPSGGRHALSVSSFAASAPSGGRHASSPSSVYLQGAGTRRCFFFCGVFASSVAASVSFREQARVECFFFCGFCSFGKTPELKSFVRQKYRHPGGVFRSSAKRKKTTTSSRNQEPLYSKPRQNASAGN